MSTKKYKAWLRWWLLFVLMILGTVTLSLSGTFGMVNQADITKISFLIYAIFGYFTIQAGIDSYLVCKKKQVEKITQRCKTGWFVSNILMTFGMIGTVIGFIYMLTTCFTEITPNDIASMRGLIKEMSIGMGTALYTTAAGLICSLLLKIQLFNLDYFLKNEKTE